MKASVLAEPVLVGREKELEELQRCLDSAVEGRGTTVFVSGEAGSGKTRLTNEFLKHARKKGVTILSGWCLSNAAVPFFPFFEAFNGYFSGGKGNEGEDAVDITDWLEGSSHAERLGQTQSFSPQVWKDQTFIAVAKTLNSISAKNPIVLFIDDLHWADSASLALFHYIARAIKSEKALLLATFRSEQLTADIEGRPHPLVETLRLMRREDLFKEIKIANLDKAGVSEIARSMLGGDVQLELAEKLAGESQGNPLFVVESLRMLQEHGGLFQEQENWRLAGDKVGIPDKIKDIILQRLSVLLHSQRKMLEAASVIGMKFDTGLLASILDQDYLEVADVLDMIERATSLVCSEGKQYRFDHARSREAIYDEISPTLKGAYHCKVAERLESASKNGKLPFSELAFHFAHAGDKEKAVKYALAAGRDALAKWSNAQAIEHFTYALQNLPEGKSEERRAALEGLGDAYAANSMYREAIKTFDNLAALESGRLRLRAIRKAMDAAYFIWGASDLLLEYSKKAEELGVDDRLELARVLVNRGRAFGWAPSGSMERDIADSNMALQVFEEEYSLADVATALWRLGTLHVVLEGLQEKALGELLRSVSIFKELRDARKEVEATYFLGVGFASCFLYPEARNEYAKVLDIGEKLGMFAELSQAYTYLARLDEGDGKLAEAISNNLKSLEYINKTDAYSMNEGMSYGGLIRVWSKLGDLKHADEWFEKSNAIVTGEYRSHWRIAPEIAWTAGVRRAAKGQWNESNQIFETLIESLINSGPRPLIVRARIDYAWSLEKQGRFEDSMVQLSEAQRILRDSEARFEHGNLQAHLMVRKKVVVGEEFEVRLDLVNLGRKPSLLVRVENMAPNDFKVLDLPSSCSKQNGSLKAKKESVGPFQVETVKLKLEATRAGSYSLNPEVTCVDNLGKMTAVKVNPLTITVQLDKPPYEVLPGRIKTGHIKLDRLLLGGIPKEHAVVLAAHSTDERALLIKRFLEAGVAAGEIAFHVTTEVAKTQAVAGKYPSNFYLFVCNPQAETVIQNMPNVFKMKGVENLTAIDIALTKAFRTLDPSAAERRICIEIVSDALLQHHVVITRRWLGSLLPTLKSKGFTILAVVDSRMHPAEELQAVVGLFDGEISVYEKETTRGTATFLKVKKMTNQKYIKDETRFTEK